MLVGGTNKTHLVKYQYEVAGKDDSLMVSWIQRPSVCVLGGGPKSICAQALTGRLTPVVVCRSLKHHQRQGSPTNGASARACLMLKTTVIHKQYLLTGLQPHFGYNLSSVASGLGRSQESMHECPIACVPAESRLIRHSLRHCSHHHQRSA